MMTRLKSISLAGLTGAVVEIEAVIHRGLPAFTIVGLGDASIQESRERVRAAIKQTAFDFPRGKVVLNLAPANLRKQGSRFDLPIALGILLESQQVTLPTAFEGALFLGELGFDGGLRSIGGVLPSVDAALRLGFTKIFLPHSNAEEAALIDGIEVYGVENLSQLCDFFQTGQGLEAQVKTSVNFGKETESQPFDFKHIRGNILAKRALEVAAAGGHNVLMSGPPGSGKTLLARAYSTILPEMTFEETLDITKVHSVAGVLNSRQPVLRKRPFRAVHHTASPVAIVGGGNPPRPGEISLAHRGVLFLDEFAEFSAKTLEVLRQPLEDGLINISRSSGTVSYPAQFSLVAAMNPCPCGYLQDPDKECNCAQFAIERYRQKISGPILDRIDVHLTVPRVAVNDLVKLTQAESSVVIQKRVQAARDLQLQRFSNESIVCNADMNSAQITQYCSLDDEAKPLLQQIVDQMNLSGRAYFRMLKLSRTIADLADAEVIASEHVAEAAQYRAAET